ncbi:MAG: hypothetical protein NZ580_07870, partial [Bacteroidia bacterium]|nr:hypothetical protein [Bacteroidia bacterium]
MIDFPYLSLNRKIMRTRILLTAACLLGSRLAAQPYLFFNQGALVHVQASALVHVQGGMQINDMGANNGVVNNRGTIELHDGSGGFRGHLLIGVGAELNSYPNSDIYVHGDYHNDRGYHRSTGMLGADNLGGTIHFTGATQKQDFRVSVDINTQGNSQNWTLNNVVINKPASLILPNRYVEIVNGTDRDMWINGTLTLTSGRILTSGTLSGGGGH